jgi:hypothetical protein
MRRALLIIAVFGVVLAPWAVQAKKKTHGVTIVSCTVNSKEGNVTNGINVAYYSTSDSPATEVDFTVNYGGHKYILIDKGTFSRGAQINHNLTNALTGEPFAGADPTNCKVSRVTLADGTVL